MAMTKANDRTSTVTAGSAPAPVKAKVQPTTARGIETRRAIIVAARQLFATKGFHRTSVPSIVEAAGVGHGTFYEYFKNRRDVLLALSHDVLHGDPLPVHEAGDDPEVWVRREVQHYIARYVANIEMSKIWSEAIAFDQEIGNVRRSLREPHLQRLRAFVVTLDRPELDADIVANALLAMLEHFSFEWFAQGDGPGCSDADVAAAASNVAELWIGALHRRTAPGVAAQPGTARRALRRTAASRA